jgi:hypothetical protein
VAKKEALREFNHITGGGYTVCTCPTFCRKKNRNGGNATKLIEFDILNKDAQEKITMTV